MALDEFTFKPYGDVKISYTWGSGEFTFEDASKQYPRRRVKAKKAYTFTIRYARKERLERFVKFYNDHKGQLDPFMFTYDGVKEMCYFSSSISPKLYVENKEIVCYECEVNLEVDSQVSNYPSALETDVLPSPRGTVTHEYDWATKVVEMVKSDRMMTSPKAREKFTAEWSGTKKTRDIIIKLFNSHCRMPLIFRHDGKEYKVRFPDSIEITDKREIQKIVGFSTSIELEVV